jgi:hypothetical protein
MNPEYFKQVSMLHEPRSQSYDDCSIYNYNTGIVMGQSVFHRIGESMLYFKKYNATRCDVRFYSAYSRP